MQNKGLLTSEDQDDLQEDGIASRQVFIIGSRRSGTTWTLWLLANHPSMVGVQHTNLVESLKQVEKWWQDDDKYRNSIVSASRDKSNKKTLKDYLSNEEFYSLCREMTSKVFAKAFNEKPDATVIVESQPENIGNLDYLSRLYPDAYFLHVIRDPRSVFSSWKAIASTWSSSDVFQTHPAGFSERWRKEILNARDQAKSINRYKEVHYEELQDNGISVLQDIFDWLGLESDSGLAEKAIEECKIGKLRDKANMPKGFFRKGLKEGWKTELTATDIQCIEYLLSDIMDDLGYERINNGKIEIPLKLRIYNSKKKLANWLRNTSVYNLLRKVKRRLLG